MILADPSQTPRRPRPPGSSHQKASQNQSQNLIDFLCQNAPKITPKSIPKSIKKSLKSQSFFALSLAHVLNAFWNHFRPSRPLIFELSPARGAIFHIFAISQKQQQILRKSSKKTFKIHSKSIKIRIKNRSKNEAEK